MPGRPWMVVVLVFLVVWPLLGFLRDVRAHVLWVGEAEGTRETLPRLLRAAVMLLLHLGAICLYFCLIWWIVSHLLSELK